VDRDGTREEVIKMYTDHITKCIRNNPEIYDLSKLKGKNLGCWCAGESPCHGDILVGLINSISANTSKPVDKVTEKRVRRVVDVSTLDI
jgi:hypothetical protein